MAVHNINSVPYEGRSILWSKGSKTIASIPYEIAMVHSGNSYSYSISGVARDANQTRDYRLTVPDGISIDFRMVLSSSLSSNLTLYKLATFAGSGNDISTQIYNDNEWLNSTSSCVLAYSPAGPAGTSVMTIGGLYKNESLRKILKPGNYWIRLVSNVNSNIINLVFNWIELTDNEWAIYSSSSSGSSGSSSSSSSSTSKSSSSSSSSSSQGLSSSSSSSSQGLSSSSSQGLSSSSSSQGLSSSSSQGLSSSSSGGLSSSSSSQGLSSSSSQGLSSSSSSSSSSIPDPSSSSSSSPSSSTASRSSQSSESSSSQGLSSSSSQSSSSPGESSSSPSVSSSSSSSLGNSSSSSSESASSQS